MNPNVEDRDSRLDRPRVAHDGLGARPPKQEHGDLAAATEIGLPPPGSKPIEVNAAEPRERPTSSAAPSAQAPCRGGYETEKAIIAGAADRPTHACASHPSISPRPEASADGFEVASIRDAMISEPWRNRPASSHFAPGEEVVGCGDAANSFYLIASGVFRGVGYTSDGRRSIFAFYWPGDVCGVEPDPFHKLTIEAVTDGAVIVLPRSACQARMKADPAFAAEMFDKTVQSLSGSAEHLITVGHGSAEECIAYFLRLLMSRAKCVPSDGLNLELVMSRQDIADFLGLTIETVSRVFTDFRKRGLIDLKGPRKLEIRKVERLKRFALS